MSELDDLKKKVDALQTELADVRAEQTRLRDEIADAQGQLCNQGNLVVSMGKRLLSLSHQFKGLRKSRLKKSSPYMPKKLPQEL